jgi:hypothetical protein
MFIYRLRIRLPLFLFFRWHLLNIVAYPRTVFVVRLQLILIFSNVLYVKIYSGNQLPVKRVKHLIVQNALINGSPTIQTGVPIDVRAIPSENVRHSFANCLLNCKLVAVTKKKVVNRYSQVDHIFITNQPFVFVHRSFHMKH